MLTNYKKSKNTNQSQKRYKLENNLIILLDSIKNLTYLTVLTIIVRDTYFKNYFVKRNCKKKIKCFNFIKLIIKSKQN
jgi:hypothetical protein